MSIKKILKQHKIENKDLELDLYRHFDFIVNKNIKKPMYGRTIIDHTQNGVSLSHDNGFEEEYQQYVVNFKSTDLYDEDPESYIELLWLILELCGYSGSKRSEKRIYISSLPGLDCDNYEEEVKKEFMID